VAMCPRPAPSSVPPPRRLPPGPPRCSPSPTDVGHSQSCPMHSPRRTQKCRRVKEEGGNLHRGVPSATTILAGAAQRCQRVICDQAARLVPADGGCCCGGDAAGLAKGTRKTVLHSWHVASFPLMSADTVWGCRQRALGQMSRTGCM
jgi:hypothetical protein